MFRRFEPFDAGCFTIVPAGRSVEGMTHPIVLGTKGAFGSGEHETTAACLDIIASLPPLSGMSAIDVGCGTGILSLAALRRGAHRVVALDIDRGAILSCRENGELNGLERRLAPIQGTLDAIGPSSFHLVMANIYLEILLEYAERVVSLASPRGVILLSGIPLQDKFDIVSRYHRLGVREVDSRIGEEFATYLFQKGS